MRIGIDSRAARWYRGTGIGTYTYQLINNLNNVDSINEYLLFMPDNNKYTIPFGDNFHLKSIVQNSDKNFWDEVNIPNILENDQIDLYHVPQNGVGLPCEKKSKFVITLHDVIPYKMPETVSERYLKIFTEQIPKIVSMCDGIITVSQYSKNDIVKAFHYPENKVYVTLLASENIYKILSKTKCKYLIKQYYSIDDDFILYVGGFSPRKNILGLIDAYYNLINKYNKNIKLVIIGKHGKSYDMYKERTRVLNIEDKVLFPGFIPIEYMPYFYNAAQLFVYPSFYEGFGLPNVEAMSCGTPVIASNVTSIPEVVQDAALLINPYDTDEICESMYRVLTDKDLRDNLISKGISRVSELSWDKTALSTLQSYKSIVQS